MDVNSLSHTRWECKYHILFAPKFRRKVAYGELKQDIANILSMLCKRKGVEIIEAEICPDHVHMLVRIPPSMSVSNFVGYLKGKSTLMIFERHANLKYKYGNRHFWCRGYYVDTVGKNAKKIQEYIQNQLKEDLEYDQMTLKEYVDPFTGEDECNDTYERCRMNQALKLKYPNEDVPSERTVYRIMERIGLSHRPNRKPHGITKADRNARKSENLLNRDFRAGSPLKKCVTDITEIPAKNGKLYVSAIFDCYDLDVLGLSMSDNMKTELCTSTIENMVKSNPSVCGMILHSDRGSQYASASYRAELSRHGIIQSMNSDGAMIMHAVRLCGQE